MPEDDIILDADILLEELETLTERRDEAIEANVDTLHDRARQVDDLSSEVDDQLAENDFTMVKESIAQAISIINDAANDEQLDELCRLAAIRLPGDEALNPAKSPDLSAFHRIIEPELPQPSGAERRPSSDDEEAFIYALRDRRNTCADRIRALMSHFQFELWPNTVEYAREADVSALEPLLQACEALARALGDAYDLWIYWINELYTANPAHLGVVGEIASESMTLFMNQYRASSDGAP